MLKSYNFQGNPTHDKFKFCIWVLKTLQIHPFLDILLFILILVWNKFHHHRKIEILRVVRSSGILMFMGSNPEHRAAWSNHGWPWIPETSLRDMWTGFESSDRQIYFLLFLYILSGWSSELSHCKNFGEKVVCYFIIAFFTQKFVITFLVLNISPKFLYWDDSEAQPDKIN